MLRVIVHHHGELVSDDPVLALDHEVAQLVLGEHAAPLYPIVKEHHETVSQTEAGTSWDAAARGSVAAGSGVTVLLAAAEVASRAAATECVSARLEPLQGGEIEVCAPALVDNLAVPFETESFQGAQDTVRAARHDARGIEILDPHEPAAAMMAGIEVAPDSRQQRAKVKVPGR